MTDRLTDEDLRFLEREVVFGGNVTLGPGMLRALVTEVRSARHVPATAPALEDHRGGAGLRARLEAFAERWEKCADRPSAWGSGWDEASCLHAQALRAALEEEGRQEGLKELASRSAPAPAPEDDAYERGRRAGLEEVRALLDAKSRDTKNSAPSALSASLAYAAELIAGALAAKE